MSSEILKENECDAASAISSTVLRRHWKEIREVIESLPKLEELERVYSASEIKSKLSDIEVDNAYAKELLDYSPVVRNRLTLMRLRCCFNF
jgi:glycerol-1-phosphate dehydrogenase [NAD(P)+]